MSDIKLFMEPFVKAMTPYADGVSAVLNAMADAGIEPEYQDQFQKASRDLVESMLTFAASRYERGELNNDPSRN